MKKFFSALILLFFSVFSYSQESVERWGKFELVCKAAVKNNPFDLKFTAAFTNGTETRTVRGFYDGTRYYPVGTTSYDWMHVPGDPISFAENQGGGVNISKMKGLADAGESA